MALRKARWLAWVALALALLLAGGCRRAETTDQAPDVQLTLSPDPDTLVVGPLRLDVTLRDASGAPIDGATDVSLRGDMSHAGMEPVLATSAGQGNGIYRADFTWTMAGDWIVTVEATLPDGRLKVTQFEYAIQPN